MRRSARISLPLVVCILLATPRAEAQGGAMAPTGDLRRDLSPLQVAGEEGAAEEEASPLDGRAVFGISGELRAVVIQPGAALEPHLLGGTPTGAEVPEWVPLHGSVRRGLPGVPVGGSVVAPDGPGIWRLQAPGGYVATDGSVSFVTPVPFSDKRGEHLNGYHIGTYPTERSARTDAYAPPGGFIEVTPDNQDMHVSRHLRLRQFLTKDQHDVWPKYVALNMRLVDKLELVLLELNLMGVRALDLHIMSGFRTPQYNGPGGDGRATLSRHMYGDAADVWVDGDGDGYIDDLNGDGRHDIRDAALLLRAVERVEQKYPELTGGAGLYESSDPRGPYVHVDVRGSRARW